MDWPRAGVWIIAGTSVGVDWQLAAAALTATARGRVALLVVTAEQSTRKQPADSQSQHADSQSQHADGRRADTRVEIRVDDAADVVRVAQALRATHGLVLLTAPAGLMAPASGERSLADLAVALSAPAVVVTAPGPDATNHTTLALAALTAHGIPAAIITIGEVDDAQLPIAAAGRIPADAADDPDFATSAARWLDPMLQAGPPLPPDIVRERHSPASQSVSGRRVVLALAAVFMTAIVIACGLALVNRPDTRAQPSRSTVIVTAGPVLSAAAFPPAVIPPAVIRPACPQWSAGVVPAPAGAAQARVDAAWKRIETWLSRHAPASRKSLRPAASQAEIDRAQRQMSVAFPPDLVASLRRHNGSTGVGGFDLPFFFRPMAVSAIVSDRTMLCTVITSGDWDKSYVPFAVSGDGGYLLADQTSGGHGRVGEFFAEDGTTFDGWPASVTELLEKTAESLTTGRPFEGRYRPKTTPDGHLEWEILPGR